MAAPRLRKVGTRKELDSLIDDYCTQGYEIINQGESSVLLRKKSWGDVGMHVLVGLLTVWCTLGLGNLAYALIAHYAAEQVLLKLEGSRA